MDFRLVLPNIECFPNPAIPFGTASFSIPGPMNTLIFIDNSARTWCHDGKNQMLQSGNPFWATSTVTHKISFGESSSASWLK
jgi:hypothetical protein